MAHTKVAVIGVFNIGKMHLDAWTQTDGAQVTAVADLNEPLRKEVQEKYGIAEGYGDYKALLAQSDADIVSVCLPTGMHQQVVTDCLRAGKHVICEKPPASSTEEARRIHECAMVTGKKVGYSLQRRFTQDVCATRHAVMQGEIGDVLYGKSRYTRSAPIRGRESYWRYDQRLGGGSLLDLGVHILDAAWYAMGCPAPLSASGLVSSAQVADFCNRTGMTMPEQPADDTAAAWIRFANGSVLVVESSFGLWNLHPFGEYCELHGTKGAVRMYPGPPAMVTATGETVVKAPIETFGSGHRGMTQDFLRAVEQNEQPCVDSRQGVVLHQMLDAIVQSAREQKEIVISQQV